jgi:hypothetical protein
MIGKKNIIFGFLYLVLSAALGPYMVKYVFPDIETAGAARQEQMSALQLMASSGYEQDLEPMTAGQIARANSGALLALNAALNAETPLDAIKGGPHAHGNLEALLNIVAGIMLGLLAVAPLFKQLISWLFLLGALLHSGSLYMVIVFQAAWAVPILSSGIGPILLLGALLLMGLAVAVGYRGRFVED